MLSKVEKKKKLTLCIFCNVLHIYYLWTVHIFFIWFHYTLWQPFERIYYAFTKTFFKWTDENIVWFGFIMHYHNLLNEYIMLLQKRFLTGMMKTLYGCTSTWTCVVPCSFVGNILICEYLLQWYIVTKLRHLVHYQLFLSLLWISKAIFHPPNSIFFLTIVIYNHSSTNLGYRW